MGGENGRFLRRGGGVNRAALCALGALVMLQTAACDQTPDKSASNEQLVRPVVRSSESGSGSVTLLFTVSPGDLPYQEKATILVEVGADAGTTITMEDYAAVIRRGEHPFELSATEVFRKEAVPQESGRSSWTYRYELSFVLPGSYELPGAAITFVAGSPASDKNEDAETDPPVREFESLSTEGITVIAEATGATALTPEQLAEIEVLPPVEMKEKRGAWAWALPLIALLAIVVIVFLNRRSRRTKPEVIVVIPAHEWAEKALARLMAEDLANRGLIQEFHYRISDILRGYIERRYSVLAREMTTEEFLATATTDARFDQTASGQLDQFLHACDLVKYAKHHATAADGESLLQTTQAFVARTRERLVRIVGEDDSNEGRAA